METVQRKAKYTLDPTDYFEFTRIERETTFAEIPTGFRVLVEGLDKGRSSKIDLVHHVPTGLVSVFKIYKRTKGPEADLELDVLKSLDDSPFLIQCYDAFFYNGCCCLVLQYAPFGSLDTLTRSLKGLGSNTMKLYAKEIAQGLGYLHSIGIIHRDVKPENMLILFTGHVVLADFNIAFKITGDRPTSTQMCGSFLTRPPEVWNQAPYDRSLDIWMYGVSLYNIACNKWPFLHAKKDRHVAAVKSGLGKVKFNTDFFSVELVDLIQQTVRVDRTNRLTAVEILQHMYFNRVSQSQAAPLSPSELLSLVVKCPTEKEITREMLQVKEAEDNSQLAGEDLSSNTYGKESASQKSLSGGVKGSKMTRLNIQAEEGSTKSGMNHYR